MYDEERDEFRREAYGIGEYQKGDPEKATGSPSTWNESGPPSWLRAMTAKYLKPEDPRDEPQLPANEDDEEESHASEDR
jgi:hypothetical protein